MTSHLLHSYASQLHTNTWPECSERVASCEVLGAALFSVHKHTCQNICMHSSKDDQKPHDTPLFFTAYLVFLWRQCCAKVLIDVMQTPIEPTVTLCT